MHEQNIDGDQSRMEEGKTVVGQETKKRKAGVRKGTKRALLTLLLAGCMVGGCSRRTPGPADAEYAGAASTPEVGPEEKIGSAVAVRGADLDSALLKRARQRGKLTKLSYETRDYDGDQEPEQKYALVYTPYGYDSSKPYDILYLMHGYTGRAETWLGSVKLPGEGKNLLDHMIQDHRIKPLLVVSMTYYDHNKDEGRDDYDAPLTKEFGRELRDDLMPVVETQFRTFAEEADAEGFRASRNHRMFGGFSMGGVTTWYRFCDSLDYFRYFLPFSGSLQWGPDSADHGWADGFWTADYLKEAASRQGFTADDYKIFASVGEEDFALDPLNVQIQAMREQGEPYFRFGGPGSGQENCTYFINPGEKHDGHGRFRSLYNTLPWVFADMDAQGD